MEEVAAGIKAYCNDLPGFTGILKHRFTDFKVFEVSKDGQVARPEPLRAAFRENFEHDASSSQPAPVPEAELPSMTIEEIAAKFQELMGSAELAEKLKNWLEQAAHASAKNLVPPEALCFPPEPNKDKRRGIHQFFKDPAVPRAAGFFLSTESSTKSAADGNKNAAPSVIELRCQTKWSASAVKPPESMGQRNWHVGNLDKKRKNQEYQEQRNMRVLLLKENHDTQSAVSMLGRALGSNFNAKAIGMAGTKDKRGITCQFLTLPRVPFDRLWNVQGRVVRARVCGAVQYCAQPLRLGDLRGNVFEIILRDIQPQHDPELFAKACDSLRTVGFVNYYGLQRFGAGAVGTHTLGALLIQGRWEETVNVIVGSDEATAKEEIRQARECFRKGDLKGALKGLPRWLTAERAIVETLSKSGPKQYLKALQSIPRTLKMMYLHAFQSYVWNHAVSKRVETYGTRLVEGDLVLLGEDGNVLDPGTSSQSSKERLAAVHRVTAEDVASGRFKGSDIVLPLPGSQVQYPSHAVGEEYYREAMKGLGVDVTASLHKTPDFSFHELEGDYRRVFQVIPDLEYSLIRYSDPNEDLVPSELRQLGEQFRAQRPPNPHKRARNDGDEGGAGAGEGASAAPPPPPPADGTPVEGGGAVPPPPPPPPPVAVAEADKPLLAMQLKFFLPSSCYATMVVRELTKESTSKSTHAAKSQAGAGGERFREAAGAADEGEGDPEEDGAGPQEEEGGAELGDLEAQDAEPPAA